MNVTEDPEAIEIRKKKRIVGVVAIALLILFTILSLIDIISAMEWLIADLIVAVIANIIFRKIGNPKL